MAVQYTYNPPPCLYGAISVKEKHSVSIDPQKRITRNLPNLVHFYLIITDGFHHWVTETERKIFSSVLWLPGCYLLAVAKDCIKQDIAPPAAEEKTPSPERDSIMNKQTSHVSHYPETKGVKRLQRLQEPHCEKNNDHTIKTNTIFCCLLARSWQPFFSCRIKTFLPPLNFPEKPLLLNTYCDLRSWGANVSSA